MTRALADTNVILRLFDCKDDMHVTAAAAVRVMEVRGDQVIQAPQTAAEFWNVCTRPADKNGLGLSVAEADQRLQLAEEIFPVLPEPEATYAEWRRLVVAHSVRGKQVHDARLVAFMRCHGVAHVLTFNGRDFARYPSVIVLDPASLVPPAA